MSDVLAPGYDIRRPQPSDFEAVHALIAASDIAEFGESSGYELDELKDDWSRMDLDGDAWLAIGPRGEIAGYAFVQHRRYVRLDAEVYVHPDRFGHGIGTTMVRLAEARVREWLLLAPPGMRLVLRNWINARNADARSLLEREGYAPERFFWRMETELGQALPEPTWPPGCSVRAADADEALHTFYQTSEDAMADHWGHVGSTFEEWRERRTGHGFDPTLWFLATAGEEPAGIAICRVTDGIGWVDSLAVRRAWRRRGLGAALLGHAFREFHRRGLPRAGLGVDAANPSGATRLYEKAGMRATQHYAAYGKELRSGVASTDAED